jgi:hypothetical protein
MAKRQSTTDGPSERRVPAANNWGGHLVNLAATIGPEAFIDALVYGGVPLGALYVVGKQVADATIVLGFALAVVLLYTLAVRGRLRYEARAKELEIEAQYNAGETRLRNVTNRSPGGR